MPYLRLAVYGCLLVASGCATRPAVVVENGTDRSVRATAETLASGMSWRLSGKVSIRTPDGSRVLRVRWLQQGDSSEIDLFAPFGVGVASIKVKGECMSVTTRDGTYRYSDDHALNVRGLGEISLPWHAFAWWVMGLKEPASGGEPIPAEGHSSGPWDIRILRRANSRGSYPSLPSLIKFVHDRATVKLKVTSWRAEP